MTQRRRGHPGTRLTRDAGLSGERLRDHPQAVGVLGDMLMHLAMQAGTARGVVRPPTVRWELGPAIPVEQRGVGGAAPLHVAELEPVAHVGTLNLAGGTHRKMYMAYCVTLRAS